MVSFEEFDDMFFCLCKYRRKRRIVPFVVEAFVVEFAVELVEVVELVEEVELVEVVLAEVYSELVVSISSNSTASKLLVNEL